MGKDHTLWAFEYFYYMDKANACIHMAPVKFSPITFGLLFDLESIWDDEDYTQEMAEVKSAVGVYELDTGR